MTQVISETLYRKYRPQTFDDILGQDEVISILQNSIKQGSISHSYLFSGTRGTGKTSIARIFAKELGTSDQDIYEIDAASNRGIGEIRELRAGVDTRPFNSDYKVYIIDEVHMLTKEAFNALLKTLEEPPSHVLFILATTEKHKILDTIISRCQVFDFNRPGSTLLVELVNKTCTAESRKIDQESAEFIASLGDGSFRDTLSHLQKVFAYIDGDISFDKVSEVMSVSDNDLVMKFVAALGAGDKDEVFSVYHETKDLSVNREVFITNVLEEIRNVLLVKYSNAHKEHLMLEMGEGKVDQYQSMKNITSKHLQDMIKVVSTFTTTQNPEAVFEVYLFNLFESQND